MALSRGIFQVMKSFIPPGVTGRTITVSACSYGIKSKWVAPLHKELYRRQKKLEKDGKIPITIRSEFIEWNYDAELYAFSQRLQESFVDSMLRQALTDTSYIERERKRQISLGVDIPAIHMDINTEISAEGMALIKDYSLKFIRSSLPLLPEEGVLKIVEYLMSVEVLSDIGHGIGLKDIILTMEDVPSPATVSKAFAAVVLALNVSSGLDRCHQFIRDFVLTQLVGKDICDIWQVDEPMSVLSDILAQSGKGKPEPRLVFHTGKKTLEAVYQVAIYSDKKFLGTGYGETTAAASEHAALDALRRLFQITESSKPLPLGKIGENIKVSHKENMLLENWSVDKAKNIVM